MRGKFEDLTGQVFGQLTVIERAPNIGKQPAWRCKCSCGNECIVEARHLKGGNSKTCGCGKGNHTHGMTGTKIYNTWHNMMDRCYYPNNIGFDHYGGRGIKVCERWHKFENFYEDVSQMENFNRAGYTLDRENVNGDYCPENCRWADGKTQNRNTRRNVKVIYNGEEITLAEAAEKSGISYRCLYNRYHRDGKRGAELFKPARNYNKK